MYNYSGIARNVVSVFPGDKGSKSYQTPSNDKRSDFWSSFLLTETPSVGSHHIPLSRLLEQQSVSHLHLPNSLTSSS